MTPAPTESTVPEADKLRRHRESVQADVIGLVAELLREQPADVPLNLPFLEMGADSLILVYAVRRLNERFGVKLEIRQFFEEISSVASLAEFIADRVPPPADAPSSSVSRPASQAPMATTPAPRPAASAEPPAAAMPVAPTCVATAPIGDASNSDVARIIQAQMQLMSRQLDLLQRVPGTSQPAQAASEPTSPAAAPVSPRRRRQRDRSAAGFDGAVFATQRHQEPGHRQIDQHDRTTAAQFRRFHSPVHKQDATIQSMAASCRAGLADSRATVGFRFSTKEILYPITGAEALGSLLKDVDGNTYIDLTMGFGALLFGSRPDFVCQAIAAELQRGIQLGMRSDLMEEITHLFREVTGKQRVVFTNSGTEAVMTALRLARKLPPAARRSPCSKAPITVIRMARWRSGLPATASWIPNRSRPAFRPTSPGTCSFWNTAHRSRWR